MSNEHPATNPPAQVKAFHTVGIIGAGGRGASLAHWCSLAGCGVIMCDQDKAAIQEGVAAIRAKFAENVQSGRLTGAEAHKLTGGIGITTGLEDFEICDLVIEAVTENLALKQALFAELSAKVDPDCVLVTASAGWPLEEIMARATLPERLAGLRFSGLSPAAINIVPLKNTSAATVLRLRALLGKAGLAS